MPCTCPRHAHSNGPYFHPYLHENNLTLRTYWSILHVQVLSYTVILRNTQPHRYSDSSEQQTRCTVAALWHLPRCGVPSDGGHSKRQRRQHSRLYAGLGEQVDLQPRGNWDPPSHMADSIGGSSVLWWSSSCTRHGTHTWSVSSTPMMALLWVMKPISITCM